MWIYYEELRGHLNNKQTLRIQKLNQSNLFVNLLTKTTRIFDLHSKVNKRGFGTQKPHILNSKLQCWTDAWKHDKKLFRETFTSNVCNSCQLWWCYNRLFWLCRHHLVSMCVAMQWLEYRNWELFSLITCTHWKYWKKVGVMMTFL